MNVKLKEAVLDDDAKMYQASKETAIREDSNKGAYFKRKNGC